MKKLLSLILFLFLSTHAFADGISPIGGSSGGSSSPNVSNATGVLPVANGGTNSAQTGNAGLQNILGGTAQLPHWNKALAKVISGKGNARVLFIGDSTMQGYYANNTATVAGDTALSFPTQFSDILNGIHIISTTNSWIGFSNSETDRSATDGRMSVGSGWSTGGTCLYLGGCWASATSTTGNLAYTPNLPVDTFIVWYPTQAGLGTLNYNIDGGSNTGISQAGSTAFAKTTITTALGNHTINFNWSSGSAFMESVESYDSTKSQVLVENAGWDTSKTSQWAASSFAYNAAPACGTFAPDLVIINLQINDMDNAIPLATYSSNLQTLITSCQSGGNTDVVLMTSNHINPADSINPTSEATQATYAAVIRSLAAANSNSIYVTGIPVIDEFANLVSYAFQNSALGAVYDPGVAPQDLHLNYFGYGIMARDIAQELMPLGGLPLSTTSTNQTTLGGTTAGSAVSNGTLTYSSTSPLGSSKQYNITFTGYENNTAVNQTITFPTPFTAAPVIIGNNTGLTIPAPSTTTLTITAPNSVTTFSGTVIVQGN